MKKNNFFAESIVICATLFLVGCNCLPPGMPPTGKIVEPAAPPKALNSRAAIEHNIMLFSSYFLSHGLPGNRIEQVIPNDVTESERSLCEEVYFGILRQAALRRGTECRLKLIHSFEGTSDEDRTWHLELFDGEKVVKEQTIHLLK